MVDFYILQRRDFAIGNFINCTPIIKTLSDHYKEKIPVKFLSKSVEDMFINCEFIEPIKGEEVSGKEVLFTSKLINQKIPDWEYAHNVITEQLGIKTDKIPHTYVDQCEVPKELIGSKYMVIVRGGVESKHLHKKDPGFEIYKYIMDKVSKNYKIVLIGSSNDRERINPIERYLDNKNVYLNNIRKSLGVLNGASFVVANDTGMYHAASALNKYVFVLWKKTNFKKNKSPGKNCYYSFEEHWEKDFDGWYDWYEEFNNN
jgi:ADP-heptose:LPS heptosyltransferase